jgi:glycosyltransferase involved in cell wall biosynthesis
VTTRPRILDIVNTDHAALHFLAYRVNWINRNTEFRNDVICSPGAHFGRIALPGTTVTPFDIPRGLSPFGLAGLTARLVRHLRDNRYTIVHTHNSITGAVGRIAARIAGVPLTIHTTHGFHFHENMGRLRSFPYIAAERLLARCCDVLLCQNQEELDDIRRLGLVPRQGVYHVGNGIDLSQFRPRASAPQNTRPVLLCVGRLEPVKNHAMLFRALAALRTRPNPPILRLVGEGPYRARYEAEVARLGLADSVQFLGYRYDVAELTAAADVVVLTSIKEGIPRALMQAMAIGVPVVATDVKGSREVVADGRTGFLVPLGDDRALTDRITRLLDTPALRREFGARGVERVRRHFDEEQVVSRLVDIYRETLRDRIELPVLTPSMAERLQAGQGGA